MEDQTLALGKLGEPARLQFNEHGDKLPATNSQPHLVQQVGISVSSRSSSLSDSFPIIHCSPATPQDGETRLIKSLVSVISPGPQCFRHHSIVNYLNHSEIGGILPSEFSIFGMGCCFIIPA